MDKLLLFLGLAVKAGEIHFGYSMTEADVKDKKAFLVLMTRDVSERTDRNVTMLCDAGGVEVLRLDADMDDIARSMGKRAGVISVANFGFAKRIKELYSLI